MNIYIENVNIANFGGLSDFSYSFNEGLNIYEGANESGKSTLAAFIKFMFYGVSGKNVGGISEKSRWTSWNGGALAGSLTLSSDGKKYRIERSLTPLARGAGKETVKVIDLENMQEQKLSCEVGEYFFGVSAEVFSETAFTLQKKSDMLDGKTLKSAIENMLFSGSEAMSTKAAIAKLDESRVVLLHKNSKGGKLYELAKSEEELYEKLAKEKNAAKELDEKKRGIESIKSQIAENNKKTELLEKYLYTARAKEVMDSFEEYDSVLAEYNTKTSEKEKAIDDANVNGYIPNEEYIASLRGTSAGYYYCVRQINEYKDLLAKKKVEHDALADSAPKGIMDLAQGRESIASKLEAADQKVRRARVNFTIFAIFSVVWLALSLMVLFVSAAREIVSPIIPFAVTAVFAIVTLISGMYLKSSLKARRELFERYSITSTQDIFKKFDDFEKNLEKRGALSDEMSGLSAEIEKINEKLEKFTDDAKTLLLKWGRVYNDIRDVEKAAADARDAVDRIGALTSDIAVLYTSLCRLKKSLFGKDREKARAIIASRGAMVVGVVSYSDAEEGLKALREKNARLEEQCRLAEIEFASGAATHSDPTEILGKIEEVREKRENLDDIYRAHILAMEALSQAGEKMRNSIAPRVSGEIETFAKDASGREKKLTIDADMLVNFRESESGITHSDVYLSSGTKDLVYIALRLSLAKLLCKDRVPPIIFDEALCQIDDDRLEKIMSLLERYKGIGQIIVLTSNSRERNALERSKAQRS